MGLPGRAKVRFNAEMQLQRATLKPRAATSSEIRWLGNLRQPKKLAVKPARRSFTTDGYGQLDVINTVNDHRAGPLTQQANRRPTHGCKPAGGNCAILNFGEDDRRRHC